MTTRLKLHNRLVRGMQNRQFRWSVRRSLASLLLAATGCGDGQDDFGPTIVRSTHPQNAAASVPAETPVSRDDKRPNAQPTTTPTEQSASDKSPVADSPGAATTKIKPAGIQVTASNDVDDSASTEVKLVKQISVAGLLARSAGNVAIFAGRNSRDLVVFDQYTGVEISRFRHSGESSISALATNPDGSLMIAGLDSGAVKAFRSTDTSNFDVHARRMLEAAQRNDSGTKGHDGAVTHVVIFPDNKRIATAGTDGSVKLWEVGTGKYQQPTINTVGKFKSHSTELLALSCLSGDRLISAGTDGEIRLWSIDGGNTEFVEVASIGPSATAVSISPDESMIVAAFHYGSVRLLPVQPRTGQEEPVSELSKAETTVAAPEDLVRKPVITHTARVRCVALSADSKILMTGCDDGMVRMWDVATQRELERTPACEAEIVSIGFPPPGADRRFVRSIVAMDASGFLQWWPSAANPDETRRTRILTRPIEKFRLAEFSAEAGSESLTTANETEQDLERLQLYDNLRVSASDEQLKSSRDAILKIESPAPQASTALTPALSASFPTAFDFKSPAATRTTTSPVLIGFSTDGTQLAAGRQESGRAAQFSATIHYWDLPARAELRQWKALPVELQQLQVGGGGQNLATLPAASLLNVPSGLASQLSENATMIVRSPHGNHFVIGERGSSQTLAPVIRLFDARTLNQLASFDAYESYLTALSFSPDGKQLVAGIRERKAHKLVSLETNSLELTQLIDEHGHEQAWLMPGGIGGTRGITQIIYSDDGRRLLTYGEYARGSYRVALWESKNEKWVEQIDRRADSRTPLMVTEAESPAQFLDTRGNRIILARESGYQILDLDNKRVEREIKLTASSSRTALTTLAPNGSFLAIGTEQGKVQLWQLDKETPVIEFPAHFGPVVGLRFSPDSSHLATVGEENVVNVWDLTGWVNQPRRLVRSR